MKIIEIKENDNLIKNIAVGKDFMSAPSTILFSDVDENLSLSQKDISEIDTKWDCRFSKKRLEIDQNNSIDLNYYKIHLM